jgi:hypothetical protein
VTCDFLPGHPLSTKTSDKFGVRFEPTVKRPSAAVATERVRLVLVLRSHTFQVARDVRIRVSE